MTAMSRKFYQSLAARFKSERPSAHAASYDMWITMVYASASVIMDGNPAFNLQRFLLACGVPGEAAATA